MLTMDDIDQLKKLVVHLNEEHKRKDGNGLSFDCNVIDCNGESVGRIEIDPHISPSTYVFLSPGEEL